MYVWDNAIVLERQGTHERPKRVVSVVATIVENGKNELTCEKLFKRFQGKRIDCKLNVIKDLRAAGLLLFYLSECGIIAT